MTYIVEELRRGVVSGNPYDAEETMDRAAAEIERLRTALREIADMPPLRSYNPDGSPAVYDAEQKIAKRALEQRITR